MFVLIPAFSERSKKYGVLVNFNILVTLHLPFCSSVLHINQTDGFGEISKIEQ